MKLVRCILQPHQTDAVVEALKCSGIAGLTLSGGDGWLWQHHRRQTVCRGFAYETGLLPAAVIDVSAEDYSVADVVRVVVETCSLAHGDNDGRIIVVPVEESYNLGTRSRWRNGSN